MTSATAYPPVTVIMPIRNEAAYIQATLGAVLSQSYPADRIEIIVVDGLSDDGTLALIRDLPASQRVTILSNPARRQAAALNLTIPQAAGEIIVRVDGHTLIAPDYVECCVKALNETGAQNVGGMMNPVGITPIGKAIAAAGKSAFAVPTAFHVSEKAQFTDTVYLGAWRKTIFDQVGYFNETALANEDYEHNYRIRRAGGKIYLTPHIQSIYYGRQSLRALWSQYFRYGIGKVEILRLHPQSLKLRHLVAPVFVAGLVAGGVAALLHPLLLLGWVSMIVIYLLTNFFFTLRLARRVELKVLHWVPIVFLVIHLSWGAGFWVGVLSGRAR